MAFVVLAITILALFAPDSCLWVQTSWINYLLMIVMFGMGLTLKLDDFKVVFTHPKELLIGCVAQFTIMPAIAFLLGKAFALEPGLLAGVALVGACPGGTSSNVITYLSRGDVALSVGMTSVNTLLAPLLTPAIAYLILHSNVSVDVAAMFLSIAQVVVVPICLGFLANKYCGKLTAKLQGLTPYVSVAAICSIVASVVSHSAGTILSTGKIVFVVVFLHNLLGYLCGFILGRVLKLSVPKTKALTVEIGMQNSGLATGLAYSVFPNLALAATPGAIFSAWHNVSGAILAEIFKRWNETSKEKAPEENALAQENM